MPLMFRQLLRMLGSGLGAQATVTEQKKFMVLWVSILLGERKEICSTSPNPPS